MPFYAVSIFSVSPEESILWSQIKAINSHKKCLQNRFKSGKILHPSHVPVLNERLWILSVLNVFGTTQKKFDWNLIQTMLCEDAKSALSYRKVHRNMKRTRFHCIFYIRTLCRICWMDFEMRSPATMKTLDFLEHEPETNGSKYWRWTSFGGKRNEKKKENGTNYATQPKA